MGGMSPEGPGSPSIDGPFGAPLRNDDMGGRSPQPRRAQITQPTAAHRGVLRKLPVLFVTVLVCASLVYGWLRRDDGYLTPETGLGYWLGITGALAMLLLLLYPLRKRIKFLHAFGSVSAWFRTHMLLGLLGPVLILFHTNFKLGSTNSNVALLSMLSVALSGIAGRYIYGKIHLGLYGRRATLADLLADMGPLQRALGHDLPQTSDIHRQLSEFSDQAMRPRSGIFSSMVALVTIRLRARSFRRHVLSDAKRAMDTHTRSHGVSWRARRQHRAMIRGHLKDYFSAVRKVAAFRLYERMFAAWHVLHLPLFFVLIITATLHVFAVHIF
jgi:hypothetical protein